MLAELFSVGALSLAVAGAVMRPRGAPEILFAVPLAAALVVMRIEPWHAALSSMRSLVSTLTFLALILVFGHLCAVIGVFDYLGAVAARASRGRPRQLLLLVVVLASVVTATLTLDATVVLLTPVVLRTTRQLRLPAKPHLYACAELANAGSLLLPISNLTNLLAFSASGLSFAHFAGLMALPWMLATTAEGGGLLIYFRQDLRTPAAEPPATPTAPRYGLAVLIITLAGFAVTSSLHIAPAWAALGGVVLLAVPMLRQGRTSAGPLLRSASLGFVGFVLALGVIVNAVTRHGIGSALRGLVPGGTSLGALLAIAFIAAILANLANNLPATLALIPVVAPHPAAVLAMLLGVNIGPNASYAGSLATLLWRRLLAPKDRPRLAEFHLYGLLSVPVILTACTCVLWMVL